MNDIDPSTSSQNRLSEQELSLGLRGDPQGGVEKGRALMNERMGGGATKERKTVRIVVRVSPTPSSQVELSPPVAEVSAPVIPLQSPEQGEIKTRVEPEPQQIPARMLNEFVYCKRLFYYEFVEGVFMDNADTLRGNAIHKKVDSVENGLPSAKSGSAVATAGAPVSGVEEKLQDGDTIHSRSVQMGSERLKVIAKMDLVESKLDQEDLFSTLTVCPVDYKAGSPRETEKGKELWDTDRMQLGLQALILRDNGYICNEGIIYYRETRQRVRLEITPDLESWVRKQIGEARETAKGAIPPPLVDSPKCVRCSLAPVCMPDETGFLARSKAQPETGNVGHGSGLVGLANNRLVDKPVRRLIASRDETRPLYLNTPGLRVGCSGEVLTVKEKDKVIEEIRMRDVSHVGLFGNIQISTQAIQTLCEEEIPVTYFSMGGWFYGITRGHELKNVFTRMEQFRIARDPQASLLLARKFVHGKIRNHRTLIMRNHAEAPEPLLLKLKRASEDALSADSIGELLGIEGSAASLYFQQFSGMIKGPDAILDKVEGAKEQPLSFSFTNRNRRPPTDPVNAMLSLAYSLLSKDCTLASVAVGLDPYVGFYHQPRFGRPALGLDLMEEFRPLIAESVVLSCINNRVITESDFIRAGEAVNLSPAARKKFFQIYEQRMSSLITHPLFDYKVSYRRALELQARILSKVLTEEVPEYIPLLTR